MFIEVFIISVILYNLLLGGDAVPQETHPVQNAKVRAIGSLNKKGDVEEVVF